MELMTSEIQSQIEKGLYKINFIELVQAPKTNQPWWSAELQIKIYSIHISSTNNFTIGGTDGPPPGAELIVTICTPN